MRRRVVVLVITTCAASVACGIDAIGTAPPPGSVEPDASTVIDGAVDVDAAEDAPIDVVDEDAGPPLVACSEDGGVRSTANHCYFPIPATTQPLAQEACVAVGAHLVTVSSAEEHTLLATVGTGDRWIGLRAAAPTNDRALYDWVTGEPKTVTYWYVNDPDNLGPCVALHGTLQQWVDRGCGDTNAAICERE